MAEQVIAVAGRHAEWEEFTRVRLLEDGELRNCHPLRAGAEAERLWWKAAHGKGRGRQPTPAWRRVARSILPLRTAREMAVVVAPSVRKQRANPGALRAQRLHGRADADGTAAASKTSEESQAVQRITRRGGSRLDRPGTGPSSNTTGEPSGNSRCSDGG
jgi:hypothetical protein